MSRVAQVRVTRRAAGITALVLALASTAGGAAPGAPPPAASVSLPGTAALALAGDTLFAVRDVRGRGTVVALDARTLRPRGTATVGSHPDGADAASSLLWVVNTAGDGSPRAVLADTVLAVDARGSRRVGVEVPRAFAVAAGVREAWAIARSPAALYRVGADGRRTRVGRFVGERAEAVDAAGRIVWLLLSRPTTSGHVRLRLVALDTRPRRVVFAVPAGAAARLAATPGGVWVLGSAGLAHYRLGHRAPTVRVAVADVVHVAAVGDAVWTTSGAEAVRIDEQGRVAETVVLPAAPVAVTAAPHELYVALPDGTIERIATSG